MCNEQWPEAWGREITAGLKEMVIAGCEHSPFLNETEDQLPELHDDKLLPN